ncbi:CaiB/BaiF CoA transferase family protein [Hoeflea prorocentri]|uniref:CaiB/BaiF CoA-transferase family protein n=1 Tax=Hoeflea prorocentri TaxID=1922333 RepID=A0A9X3ZG12_9HYPH|nr:CaiB/BaiF CoA-transferase family protein [Hoeflea prorocentri]MCY6379709.1 CaiB/BaiF CoA-transferase family protein [Hoeflea prorocentri]MDA5397509.1 CaiB/BaiF CoA-transferase family protein [Hoeflea prorocentri]
MAKDIQHGEGPLSGLRIIEFAGIGPGPFAAMMLSDMGADVIRIDRLNAGETHPNDFTLRGRQSVAMNLKMPAAVESALKLIETADGLIEGFRPGVMERLGLGPEICHAINPRLVYGRMTGWGQAGPLAQAAGHDLNYISLTGGLWATGEADRSPTFAMNLLGDYGGGGMYLAFGMVSGLLQAQRTGQGDIVDAAICDGVNSLMTFIHSRRAMGMWRDERAANPLDGGRPWYGVYECADGNWISIGAIEPQFWACLLQKLGLDSSAIGDRQDPNNWPSIRKTLEERFLSQPRDHWDALLSGTDACFAPVLSPAEAREYPHLAARTAFAEKGAAQPMPAPRFSRAGAKSPQSPRDAGADTLAVLTEAGFTDTQIANLIDQGAIAQANTKENTK